jgi:hypothetical protein
MKVYGRRPDARTPRYFSTCYDWRGNLRWVVDYLMGPGLTHHSHCPQPVQVFTGAGRRKPVAYSLGSFCTWRPRALLQYGIAFKLTCGPDATRTWTTGAVDWAFTHVRRTRSGFRMGLSDSCELIPETPGA